MKKVILFIPLIASIYLIQTLDPNKSSDENIEKVKTTISELELNINVEEAYKYINKQWFIVKSTLSGLNISKRNPMELEGEEGDVHISLTKSPKYSELSRIAEKIDQNETKGIASNRVHWNVGEKFASMGIGHFLWYPTNHRGSKEFSEQFPDMIRYLDGIGVDVPNRLLKQIDKGAYWSSRAELNNSRNTEEYKEVLKFLSETKMQQAQFIQQKFMLNLLRLYSISNKQEMNYMNAQMKRISAIPGGWYVLIDYTNFKGIGGTPNKKYNDVDWGLKQVILNMKKYNSSDPLIAFSKAAKLTLKTRVENSPNSRRSQETKWLNGGWTSRVNGYKNPYI